MAPSEKPRNLSRCTWIRNIFGARIAQWVLAITHVQVLQAEYNACLSIWHILVFGHVNGLMNSPSTFQRLVEGKLKDLDFVLVHLDDVFIFCKKEEEHMDHLSIYIQKIAESHQKLKINKCSFMQRII